MSRNLLIKIFVLVLVGNILLLGVPLLDRWLSRELVVPLVILMFVVGWSVVVKTAWRRQQDGTYVETKAIRWIMAGLLLVTVMLLVLSVYFALVLVFLMPD